MSKKNEVVATTSGAAVMQYHDVPTPPTFEEASKQIVDINKSIKTHAVIGYWTIGKMVHEMQLDEGKYVQAYYRRMSQSV